jgi:putative ABC transport system substrate-binding protein
MRRRNFIALLSGAAVSWSLAARAQQGGRMHRIGVLMAYPETDPEGHALVAAFRDGLRKLGWLEGKYRLPAVYPRRFYTQLGGLLSYGNDQFDNYRRAATYADRILRGTKPSDLPVQIPFKFDLVINLKTAKTLGLDVPFLL